MKTRFEIDGRVNNIDLSDPIDISIPLQFNGPQPNAFGVKPATSKACEYGSLVGDTRLGGSVNFEQITLIPHCSGTHTECVGHITNERISVTECLLDIFMPALLVSAGVSFEGDDLIVSADSLSKAVTSTSDSAKGTFQDQSALIVRTLPNDDHKLSQTYDTDYIPPYFTTEAIEFIVKKGFKHFLVDLPSIDRLFDDGKLLNHRKFWNVEPGSFEVNENTRLNSTITELIYVPNEVADGEYLLNLQIAPFISDAAPSRPVLFAIT